MIENIYVT